MRLLSIIVVAILLVNSVSYAAVPASITIQGRLTDASGVPLPAGSKNFVFKVFDTQTLGTEIWPAGTGENQILNSDAAGLWIGLLGAVVPITDTVFADSVRWLEVTVDGTTLPRVRLVTGPYAHRVSTLDGASGGAVSGPVHLNAPVSFADTPDPMMFIYDQDSGTNDRFIAAYSALFPDWGISYRPADDVIRMRSINGTALAASLIHARVGVGSDAIHSTLTVQGSTSTAVTTVSTHSATLVLNESHSIIIVSGQFVKINFPDPATCPGRMYTIKQIPTANFVTLNATVGLIEGEASMFLYTPASGRGYAVLVSDGVGWHIVSTSN